jgi:MFS family permease
MEKKVEILRKERKIINLVSAAHFFSHLYLLALPPLFLTIKEDLNVTFTQLGMVISVYAVGSFVGQYPMGVFADKYGPKWLLIYGMLTVSCAFILMGLIPVYWIMVGLALLAGLGDSVFHPANFVVLTASVVPERSGRAYAFHAFAGFAGFATAPIVVDAFRVFWNWNFALIFVGCLGIIMTLVLISNKNLLNNEEIKTPLDTVSSRTKNSNQIMGVLEFIKFPPIVILFFFYVAVALAGSGIQQFSSSALPVLYAVDISAANQVLFFYMVAIALGILAGGYIADKVTRLDMVASIGYLIGSLMICIVALQFLSFTLVSIALVVAGFMMGIVMPSRDVLVRAVTPKGNAGKAFGFVNSGFGFAGIIGPLIFGSIMDSGQITWIYYGAAIFMGLTIITALAAGRFARTNTICHPAE